MSELGFEAGAPDEGLAGAPEELSEEAKQRFAAAAAAMQQIRREEKRSKRRDDRLAQVIMQFLGTKRAAHLFVLISRLVARDCPSVFLLGLLSLVHEESRAEVQAYLLDQGLQDADQVIDRNLALTRDGQLDEETNRELIAWITRLQLVLSTQPEQILTRLMVDEHNVDGTVLQLATFLLRDFFRAHDRSVPFEQIQPLTASILQTVFEPFINQARSALRAAQATRADDETDEGAPEVQTI